MEVLLNGEIGLHEDSFNEDEEMIDGFMIELVRLNPDVTNQAGIGDR